MASQTTRRSLAIIRGYLQNCVHKYFVTFRGLQLCKTLQRLNLYSILGKIPINVVKTLPFSLHVLYFTMEINGEIHFKNTLHILFAPFVTVFYNIPNITAIQSKWYFTRKKREDNGKNLNWSRFRLFWKCIVYDVPNNPWAC